jgi:hypothetical protein
MMPHDTVSNKKISTAIIVRNRIFPFVIAKD